jgi:hypothetical protein
MTHERSSTTSVGMDMGPEKYLRLFDSTEHCVSHLMGEVRRLRRLHIEQHRDIAESRPVVEAAVAFRNARWKFLGDIPDEWTNLCDSIDRKTPNLER